MKYLFLLSIIFLTACGPQSFKQNNSGNSKFDSTSIASDSLAMASKLVNKTVKFLWRENKYDESLKDTFNSIVINQDYCQTISNPEKAALGYVATFIGNECNWDGEYKEDRSNLKCKILTALNLGYQCSENHLGFLRKQFKNDAKVLDQLKSEACPTTPDGATIQETFDAITLSVKGDLIIVYFEASGVNTRESDSWTWNETDHFKVTDGYLQLVKKDESSPKHQHFDQ